MGCPSPGNKTLQMSPRIYVGAYSSDGDTNGIFYFAGQGYVVGGTWANPQTNQNIVMAASGIGSGTLDSIVNRDSSDTFDNNALNNWFSVYLGVGRYLIPSHYTFRQRSSGGDLMTLMKLQSSSDNLNWTDLTTADAPTQTADVFTSFSVAAQPNMYSYFRLIRTGPDTGASGFFCIGEWELYGTLFY
jgi:hypothetical protein